MVAGATIRKPVPSDVEYLLKTWGREHRRALPRALPDRLFYHEFQKIMYSLVSRSDARVICAAEDPNYILGFVIGTVHPDAKTAVVHFAYVRSPFRRAGMVREALRDMGWEPGFEIVASHWSDYVARFDLKALNLVYNPYILYGVG